MSLSLKDLYRPSELLVEAKRKPVKKPIHRKKTKISHEPIPGLDMSHPGVQALLDHEHENDPDTYEKMQRWE